MSLMIDSVWIVAFTDYEILDSFDQMRDGDTITTTWRVRHIAIIIVVVQYNSSILLGKNRHACVH